MSTTASRAFATVSLIGLVVTVVASVLGHIGLGPGFNPLSLTVSDYALSDRGGAIEVAMVALALGSLALLAGLTAVRAPVRGLPTALMLVWGVGLLIAAVVPTDPLSAPSISLAGNVHRYASIAGFVSLPMAAAILSSRFRGTRQWAALAAPLRRLALACGAGLVLFWYVAFPGGRVMMGLVERSLIGVEIVMLLALSVGLYRFRRPGTAHAERGSAVLTVPVAAGSASLSRQPVPAQARRRVNPRYNVRPDGSRRDTSPRGPGRRSRSAAGVRRSL